MRETWWKSRLLVLPLINVNFTKKVTRPETHNVVRSRESEWVHCALWWLRDHYHLYRIAKNVVTLHTSHNQCHENVAVIIGDTESTSISENARIWLISSKLSSEIFAKILSVTPLWQKKLWKSEEPPQWGAEWYCQWLRWWRWGQPWARTRVRGRTRSRRASAGPGDPRYKSGESRHLNPPHEYKNTALY